MSKDVSRPGIEPGSQDLASCAARPPQHNTTGPRHRAFDMLQGSCYSVSVRVCARVSMRVCVYVHTCACTSTHGGVQLVAESCHCLETLFRPLTQAFIPTGSSSICKRKGIVVGISPIVKQAQHCLLYNHGAMV